MAEPTDAPVAELEPAVEAEARPHPEARVEAEAGLPVFVFDAYGTLFDVHAAVAAHADRIGPKAEALSALWRTKQLEYSWTRSLMKRYRPFWSLTEEALGHALAAFPDVDPAIRPDLLSAYETLSAYPEVPGVLARLKAKGARTAILSNGSAQMLSSAVTSAGLGAHLDAVLSVDVLQTYKTDPATYRLVLDQFGVEPGAVRFHSSNRWDIAGAHAFGFRTLWINRAGAADEYAELAPDRTVSSLDEAMEDLSA
ncbi:MAG: haloacid dehalogenase type II [Pseudomonadota bacterium]